MAKKLQRNFIGFEQDQDYIKLAKKRLKNTEPLSDEVVTMTKSRKDLPKVPFGELVEQGIIPPGAVLTDKKERFKATVSIDGTLKTKKFIRIYSPIRSKSARTCQVATGGTFGM